MVRRLVTYFPVTLIVLAFGLVVASGTYYYVQRASDRLESARHHSDQQFAKALIVTDRKFRQALRITTQQFSYAQNKSVCGFRKIANDGLVRARKVLKDPTASHATRASAQRTIQQAEAFLATQVTVPADFNCSTLPEKPPKAQP